MSYTIYWQRHANACSNMLNILGQSGPMGFIKHIIKGQKPPIMTIIRDSLLSNLGVRQAQVAGMRLIKEVANVQVVFCSNLSRAIETAIYAYPNKLIYPIPHISELRKDIIFGSNKMNEPLTVHELMRRFPQKNIHWDILMRYKHVIKPSFTKFMKEIIPEIIKLGYRQMIIISHGDFIRYKVAPGSVRLNNTGVIKHQVEMTKDKYKVFEQKLIYNPTSIIFNGVNIDITHNGLKKSMTSDMLKRCHRDLQMYLDKIKKGGRKIINYRNGKLVEINFKYL